MSETGHTPESELPRGVLSVREDEAHYYEVKIRWIDGEESAWHFPNSGFTIVDPETHSEIRKVTANEAIEALRKTTASMKRDEFDWEQALSTE